MFGEAPRVLWTFPAAVTEIVDGDTVEIVADLGFDERWVGRVRLLGVDTHETHGKKATDPSERALGEQGRAFTEAWLAKRTEGMTWPLVCATHAADHFGRRLAVLWARLDGACLNDDLLASGLAAAYWGPDVKRRAWIELTNGEGTDDSE